MFYVPLVFAKFGEILVKYFVYESVFGFPPFQSYYWSFFYSSQKRKFNNIAFLIDTREIKTIHRSNTIMSDYVYVLGDKIPIIRDAATPIHLVSKKTASSKR